MKRYDNRGRGLRSLPTVAAAGVLLALPLTACDVDSILDVEDPVITTPGQLNDPANLQFIVNGAVADFQVAWNGDQLRDTYSAVTGLFTDELRSSDTFTTRIDTDSRRIDAINNNTDGVYRDLQRARVAAHQAGEAVATLEAEDDARRARMLSLEGFAIVGLAEAFCGNVPLTYPITESEFDFGPGLRTSQLLDTAVVHFEEAREIAIANDDADQYYLASIGLGRALLDLGDAAGAAAAVEDVPTLFTYKNEYSANSSRQENDLFHLTISNSRYTVVDEEGGTGEAFIDANDPRVLTFFSGGAGFDGTTPLIWQLRYPERDADQPFATGVEARLIEAEGALNAGNYEEMVDILNFLRANTEIIMNQQFDGGFGFRNYIELRDALGYDPTPGEITMVPANQAAAVDLLFSERAFWLYLTGHRLGDLRRLIRDYGRTAEQVFPTGAYFKGGNYGSQISFPIPFEEANNTEFNADQCNVNSDAATF